MSLQCLLFGCLILIMPTLSKRLVLPPIPLNLIFGSLYLWLCWLNVEEVRVGY
jgi:hypothetical protein